MPQIEINVDSYLALPVSRRDAQRISMLLALLTRRAALHRGLARLCSVDAENRCATFEPSQASEGRQGECVLSVRLAVNGTLMRGLALNKNLIVAGATFVRETTTSPSYRLWSIDDRHPAMVRVSHGGVAVAVEVWDVPAGGLASVLLAEPPGLSIGKVRLADGEQTLGVLGEPVLCEGQRDITQYGGWRAYVAARERSERA